MAEEGTPDGFSLDLAFFLVRTRARQLKVSRILKALKLKRGEGKHVFSHAFGTVESTPYLLLHLDESKYADDAVSYYVQLHMHGAPDEDKGDPRKPGVAWAFRQLAELAKGEDAALFFFDAETEIEAAHVPTSVVAPPLTLAGRSLAVVGVEFGAPIEVGGIDRFRWTSHKKAIKVNLSFTENVPLTELPRIWNRAKAKVEGYVREVFPR